MDVNGTVLMQLVQMMSTHLFAVQVKPTIFMGISPA
jgi:hypothetical protein